MSRAASLMIALVAAGCGGRVGEESAATDSAVVEAFDTSAVDEPMRADSAPPPADTSAPDTSAPDTTMDSRDSAPVGCPTHPQCSDGVDNDGDGLIDGVDPECTSARDGDEASFYVGFVGDFDTCKQDCFFDNNISGGDDGCWWYGWCLSGFRDSRCPYDATKAADPKLCPAPSDKCKSYCQPLTPPGCDCTGCCDVTDSSGTTQRVRLSASCTMKDLKDPTKCAPCEKITTCGRECGRCDYCIGKWALPSDCAMPACASGAERCGPDMPCACGKYCLTGCCIPAPI